MFILSHHLCLALAVTWVAGDCWETKSCQLNSWQTKGCAQYGRVEQSRRQCSGGYHYTCCIPTPGVSGESTGGSSGSTDVRNGKTTRCRDCCKPSCSWNGKASVTRPVSTCAKNGIDILGVNTKSGCNGGTAFVCNNQQPFLGPDNVAYGFAAAVITGQNQSHSCCACYELTFTSGPVRGQKMIVQVTNTGADLGDNHFDLQLLGGGVGIFNGCKPQWGAPDKGWGQQYGGVRSLAECSQLPSQIRDGCKFRFGWFKNADNPKITFVLVTCPVEITRTRCVRNAM